MSLAAHLIHRCTLQRAEVSTDAYNNTARRYADRQREVLFRLVVKGEQVQSAAKAELVTVTTYLALFAAGTDIREDDQVTGVVLEDGSALGRTFTVRAVMERRGRALQHISVELKAVS